MKISIIPLYDHYLNNRLFQFTNTWTDHWQEGNVELYQECMRRGHQISTWDLLPIEEADVVLFLDYPKDFETVRRVKQQAPQACTLLTLYESPLDNPRWFNANNHKLFDGVLTYNSHRVDHQHYFKLYLPIGLPPQANEFPGFERRAPLAMVNANYYIGLTSLSRPWHFWNQIQALRQAGWHCSVLDYIQSLKGDLRPARRRIARTAEQYCPDVLDLYGRGWEEARDFGWYYRFFPDSPYRQAKGVAQEDKLQLLSRYRFVIAYENYEGDVGYISEKIFDALYAGTVPIYRGDQNIQDYVWPECFIDGRKFKDEAELLDFVVHCPQNRWQELQAAGQQYLKSEQIKQFQPTHYVNSLLMAIEALGPKSQPSVLPV
jgi:alpha(1,3/1,4) fucosyltransferase